MPIYQLDDSLWFPLKYEYEGDIVAVGGDLRPERLIQAYSMGIFPWYNEPGEQVWWCPEERAVIPTDAVHISHSMRSAFNKRQFDVTVDTVFDQVLEGCRGGERLDATWLIDEMYEAYHDLHRRGIAHSVEVWQGGQLVGGFYGVSLGKMFCGESMFARVSNASKYGFIWFCERICAKGWTLIDCQVMNNHLASLGAQAMAREDFLNYLDVALKYPTQLGPWTEWLLTDERI
jgi:leucyl/phenylalanyl-tRNA---protein transferase